MTLDPGKDPLQHLYYQPADKERGLPQGQVIQAPADQFSRQKIKPHFSLVCRQKKQKGRNAAAEKIKEVPEKGLPLSLRSQVADNPKHIIIGSQKHAQQPGV